MTTEQFFDTAAAEKILDEALHRAAVDLPVTPAGVLTMLAPTLKPTTAKCEWYFCPSITASVPRWQHAWGVAHDVCAAARQQVFSETCLSELAALCRAAEASGSTQVDVAAVRSILTKDFEAEAQRHLEDELTDYDLNAR